MAGSLNVNRCLRVPFTCIVLWMVAGSSQAAYVVTPQGQTIQGTEIRSRANGDIVLAGNGYKVEDLYELEPQITFSVKNSIDNNTKEDNNEKNIEGIKSLNHSENQGGFSMPEDKTKYSINDNFKFANNKFLKSLGLKSEENVNVMKKESDKNDVNVARRFLNSFRRTTEKYPKLKPFFRVARKAQEVQENLRWIGYNKMDSFSKDLLNKEK